MHVVASEWQHLFSVIHFKYKNWCYSNFVLTRLIMNACHQILRNFNGFATNLMHIASVWIYCMCLGVFSNTVPIFIFAYYHETKVSFRFLQHNNEFMFFSTSKILDVGLPISYKFGWHKKIWKYHLLGKTLNTRNGCGLSGNGIPWWWCTKQRA